MRTTLLEALEALEAFAVDALNGPLRDEGLRINLLNDARDGDRLLLTHDDQQHLLRLPRIAARSLQYGTAAV